MDMTCKDIWHYNGDIKIDLKQQSSPELAKKIPNDLKSSFVETHYYKQTLIESTISLAFVCFDEDRKLKVRRLSIPHRRSWKEGRGEN